MFKIVIHKNVKDDLKDVPKSHIKAVKDAINSRLTPRPYDFKALSGKHYRGLYRLRISDFRVIYRIDEEPHSVIVLAIGHRKLIYKNLDKIVKMD